ncbi:hypothetical protein [Nitrososphaera sp.]|uniref:hypothetical protein n=1 Tax=Nitrososphaera sp. TaxID=1971748 RepID=UPI0017A2E9F9|nr:hypothetical protein [Nitrososphaera sp.]NWG38202.1 hypothetical protein [Nitrososphaera sp.]
MTASENFRAVMNAQSSMKNIGYWKEHYVIETDADEIERNSKLTHFVSDGKSFELLYFEKGKDAPNILISQGSAGHSRVFAELGYLMHLQGYNVFIMPKHGGYTISKLVARHKDALQHILTKFNDKIGVYAEGLGGYATFYLALAHGPMKSMVLENAPAILTEKKFHIALFEGKEHAAERRKKLLPLIKILAKLFPRMTLPISVYLDFSELIDTKQENREIERRLVESFLKDPDFDRRYPLSAIMSLVSTSPPNPLSVLKVPTMLLVAKRGLFASYLKDLYGQLPDIEKRLVEVDGGVFWMCSHKKEAVRVICGWFDKTLKLA